MTPTKRSISSKPTQSRGTVFVGLSGGVDSSVSAALLKDAGYDVTGVFIKAWHPDFLPCTWQDEKRDAMRVCAALDIPFMLCDAEEAYKKDVVDYMIAEYKKGRTPNPDVMCNKYVKFGVFFDFAMAHGADFVATGHYAQTNAKVGNAGSSLVISTDTEKDQTYFLWTLTQDHIAKTLFPVGHLKKPQVRKLAEKYNLHTFEKKDSQGLCFMGKVDLKEFLAHYIPGKKGKVIDEKGKAIGSHDGAVFYTIGERHGFGIDAKTKTSKDAPYYIVAKDLRKNTLTVSHDKPEDNADFGRKEITLEQCNFTAEIMTGEKYGIRLRYRQELQEGIFTNIERAKDGSITAALQFQDLQQAVPGQSCVVYDGNLCLGGGIVR